MLFWWPGGMRGAGGGLGGDKNQQRTLEQRLTRHAPPTSGGAADSKRYAHSAGPVKETSESSKVTLMNSETGKHFSIKTWNMASRKTVNLVLLSAQV